MRRALALGVLLLGLVAVDGALAGSALLVSNKGYPTYGASVRLTVTAQPTNPTAPKAGYAATIERSDGVVIAAGTTNAQGQLAGWTTIRRAYTYTATVSLPDGDAVDTVAPRVRPRLRARVFGDRTVGAKLVVRGRVLPARAGRLELRLPWEARDVRVSSTGSFRTVVRTRTHAEFRAALRVLPRGGYMRNRRQLAVPMRRPALRLGASGVAVRALERRLRELHHVLRGVDGSFGVDTYQAVVAFQKIHGLGRTGRVGDDLWSRVTRARIPSARIPHGDHIEVSKTRQVMYEVVGGEVARIVHVSTGATGNTPVGDWRSYRLGPGGSLSGMYYSIYFLRGFAIHGYHSVPTYPASHGCVRTPLWFAPGFYERWGRIGVRIVIFP